MKNKILVVALVTIVLIGTTMVYSLKNEDKPNTEEEIVLNCSIGEGQKPVYLKSENIGAFVSSGDISSTAYSIEALRNKFPSGMYWNHEGKGKNDPNSVTSIPCHTTGYSESCCNLFEGGAQCVGYALYLSYLYHNNVSTYTYGISHNISDLKVGDMVRYRLGNYDHAIFITAIDGEKVTYSDCNYDLHCRIRWGVQTTKTALSQLMSAKLNVPYDTVSHQYSTKGFILSFSKRKIIYDIQHCEVVVTNVDRYKGETEPRVTVKHEGKTLREGVDYRYFYASKFDYGGTITIQGVGDYEGSVDRDYKIIRQKLSDCTASYNTLHEYTGELVEPTNIIVKNKYGKIIDKKYYTVSYSVYPIEPGTYNIYIMAADNQDIYEDELVLVYHVIEKNISNCEFVYAKRLEFTGDEVCPRLIVKNRNKILEEGRDYTVLYKNNKAKGTALICVNAKDDRYTGSIELEYELYVKENVFVTY